MNRMRWLQRIAAVLAGGLLAATLALAAPVAEVASPGGKLRVVLTLNGEGRIGYEVLREGKLLVEESRLGFILTDAP